MKKNESVNAVKTKKTMAFAVARIPMSLKNKFKRHAKKIGRSESAEMRLLIEKAISQ